MHHHLSCSSNHACKRTSQYMNNKKSKQHDKTICPGDFQDSAMNLYIIRILFLETSKILHEFVVHHHHQEGFCMNLFVIMIIRIMSTLWCKRQRIQEAIQNFFFPHKHFSLQTPERQAPELSTSIQEFCPGFCQGPCGGFGF